MTIYIYIKEDAYIIIVRYASMHDKQQEKKVRALICGEKLT